MKTVMMTDPDHLNLRAEHFGGIIGISKCRMVYNSMIFRIETSG